MIPFSNRFFNFLVTGLLIVLPVFNEIFAQIQPLSRNDKALVEQYLGAYENELADENWMEASRHMNDVAFLYWEHNDYPKAIEYYELSLALNEKLNNENGLAMIHNNLGMLYADVREYEKSITYFQKNPGCSKIIRQ